jgi:hypothetical protein
MHRRGRLDGDASYQWHLGGIAGKHHDLLADVHRCRRHVLSSQYDGGGAGRPGGGQRRVRIGERHDGIVYTFDQSLLNGHVVVRGRLGPMDMELRRFQRRHHRELLCVRVGVCIGVSAIINSNSNSSSNSC